ncbi:MAG: GLPGLI family protein [Saprospiraceae bacterium]|nr:GLPGLI family protein [Saprospiraceae bacterium]
MKKLSILFLLPALVLTTAGLFLPSLGFAQFTEGVVTYTETIKMKIEVPEGMDEAEFRKMVPSEQKVSKILVFNANECLYSDAPDQAPGGTDAVFNSQNDDGGEMRMDFKVQRPENHQYRDIENGKRIESTEFFGRFFLIEEEPKRLKWKVSAEQKQVAGYPCQKAVLQDTSRQVEAWFTPQIPVSIGPGEFADLPGMILELSMANGDRTVVAEKVKFKALDKKAIEKPTKGKSVTREEFLRIRDEKMKEMGATPGGGGTMKVIIRN